MNCEITPKLTIGGKTYELYSTTDEWDTTRWATRHLPKWKSTSSKLEDAARELHHEIVRRYGGDD
jgi:hypothetical protein